MNDSVHTDFGGVDRHCTHWRRFVHVGTPSNPHHNPQITQRDADRRRFYRAIADHWRASRPPRVDEGMSLKKARVRTAVRSFFCGILGS